MRKVSFFRWQMPWTHSTNSKPTRRIADQLIDELSKAQIAECARMQAVHIADYRQRFGEIPHADLLHLGHVVEIGDEQAALLRDGMEVLVGYLGNVREGLRKWPAH